MGQIGIHKSTKIFFSCSHHYTAISVQPFIARKILITNVWCPSLLGESGVRVDGIEVSPTLKTVMMARATRPSKMMIVVSNL